MAMLQAWNLPGPPAGGRAYVGGEAKAVVDIRALLSDKGLPAEAMSVKAYWRADASNADHGEPGRT
jgi:NADPH-dependent ferric siderophore reductase